MNVVIVTGASSGLGREFAKALATRPDAEEIWVIARRADRLNELKNTINKNVIPLSLDLTKKECIEKYKGLLSQKQPNVIALVNAAGFGKFGEIENLPLSDQLGMIDLNISALTAMTHVTLPYMKKGAEIYQIGSLSAFQPFPYISAYAATKAYVLSYSRSLNVELKHRGIRVIAVSPSWTKTEFLDHTSEHNDVVSHYGRLAEPDQVVRLALKDMKRGRDFSIYGKMPRFQAFLMKVLPHTIAMKIWCRLQKK